MRDDKDLPLIQDVREIFENSRFDFVTERIHYWKKNDDEELTETDVCAILENKMFIVECKSAKLNNKKYEIDRKQKLISAIKSHSISKIKSDSSPKLTTKMLDNIDYVYLGYYFGDESVFHNQKSSLTSKNFLVWNNDDVNYFLKVSERLGNHTQNEIIFREFNVKDDEYERKPIPAIKFKQRELTLHLFVLDASKLLRIAYVSRRGTNRDESYQRIINPHRLKALANFITESKHLIMANPVILSFDQDVYGAITYDENGRMNFKNIPCSAWVIDGQHRIFAFKDLDLESKKGKKFNIKIPVVALEKSKADIQSETFVNINYYQKKMESLLIYDLAADFQYARNELVWPSLLTMNLNENGKLKGLIKTKELEKKNYLQSTNFVKTILDELLGYNPSNDRYDGPLYKIAKFNKNTRVKTKSNEKAFKVHSSILQSYFATVMSFTKKPNTNWKKNAKNRGFLTSSAIQAFLLILGTILRTENKQRIKFVKILKPLKNVDFTNEPYSSYREGYPKIQGITKDVLKIISRNAGKKYEYIKISQLRKKQKKSS